MMTPVEIDPFVFDMTSGELAVPANFEQHTAPETISELGNTSEVPSDFGEMDAGNTALVFGILAVPAAILLAARAINKRADKHSKVN